MDCGGRKCFYYVLYIIAVSKVKFAFLIAPHDYEGKVIKSVLKRMSTLINSSCTSDRNFEA